MKKYEIQYKLKTFCVSKFCEKALPRIKMHVFFYRFHRGKKAGPNFVNRNKRRLQTIEQVSTLF